MLLRNSLAFCRYALSFAGAFKANLRREYTLIARHSFVYAFRFTQVKSLPNQSSDAHYTACGLLCASAPVGLTDWFLVRRLPFCP